MNEWQRAPLPLSALCYDGNRLHVRLSGAEHAVTAARRNLGGEIAGGRRDILDGPA